MAAKNKFMNAMKMPAIADMFSSEADRQRESGDLVTEVPLSELHPFVNHPFEVRDDEDMQKLVDSIKENGVLTNLTVRPRAEGGYEIISGHRRFHAAQLAGLDKIKVQVRDVDDDQAIIDMVDANIQREHISPMEKARAYAMKLEAISMSLKVSWICSKLTIDFPFMGSNSMYCPNTVFDPMTAKWLPLYTTAGRFESSIFFCLLYLYAVHLKPNCCVACFNCVRFTPSLPMCTTCPTSTISTSNP